MAGHAAKKQYAENQASLRFLLLVSAGTSVVHVLLRYVLLGGSTTVFIQLLSAVSLAVVWGIYYFLWRSAQPKIEGTTIVDGGPNLRTGILEYCFDISYVTSFVLVTSCLTDWAWLLLLVVPAYAAYLIYSLFFGSSGGIGSLFGDQSSATGHASRRRRR